LEDLWGHMQLTPGGLSKLGLPPIKSEAMICVTK
jgi:hypothetical protein